MVPRAAGSLLKRKLTLLDCNQPFRSKAWMETFEVELPGNLGPDVPEAFEVDRTALSFEVELRVMPWYSSSTDDSGTDEE